MFLTRGFFVCLVAALAANFGRAVRLEDGKYQEVTVALSPNLNPSNALNLAKTLKTRFEQASTVLCQATDGRLSYGSLYVILPRNWKDNFVNESRTTGPLGRRRRLSSADIKIENGNINDVQQTQGCGQRGDFIMLSSESILNGEEYFERRLVALWSRWRFGVFSEEGHGFYYHPEERQFIPNSCTDHSLLWNATHPDTDDICVPDMETECKAVINSEGNENITSSLLYKHDLPNMKHFCTEETHNHFASTPQNLFCKGKSVWEVLKMNDDFKFSNASEDNETCHQQEVEVHLVYPNFKRIYVLLALKEITKEITESLTASLLMTAETLLEEGDEIVVMYNGEVSLNITINSDKTTSLENILELSRYNTSTSQGFLYSVKQFVKMINGTDDDLDRFVFIVSNTHDINENTGNKTEAHSSQDVTEEPSLASEIIELVAEGKEAFFFDEVIENFKELALTVNTVTIGKNTEMNFEEISRKTGGQSYFLKDLDNPFEPILIKPLINALKDDDNQLEMIVHDTIQAQISSSRNYYIDQNFKEVNVFINNFQTQLVGLVTVNDTDTPYYELLPCSILIKDSSVILCKISEPRPSMISLLVHQPKEQSPQSIDIFGIPKVDTEIFQTSAWFNENSPKMDLSKDKFLIFAKVHKGGKPFLDANVSAQFITDNDERFQIKLLDNGIGGDLFKNDGIYTAQVSNCLSIGRYSVDVKIIGKCYNGICHENSPESSFERSLTVGSVIFTNCQPSGLMNTFPVRDLNLTQMLNGNATLSWTETLPADINNVTYTLMSMIHWSNEASNWATNGTVLKEIKNITTGSMHVENVEIDLQDNETIFVALIAKDNEANSAISNIVTILKEITHGTPETTTLNPTSDSTLTPKATDESKTSETNVAPVSTDASNTSSDNITDSVPSSTADVNSSVNEEISSSSRSAAAGIIAVVVLVSVAGIASLSYYFIYYRRRAHNDPSYSVGYSNLE